MLFNRVLKMEDYKELQPQLAWFSNLLNELSANRLNTALNHTHRRWEFSLAKAIVEQEGQHLSIIDVGSGASPLGIGMKLDGHEVWETDSCAYGNPVHELRKQCIAFGVKIPWVEEPAEAMPSVPSDYFDVVLCTSVMEHVDREREKDAWLELKRIAKPGGVIFATMDFHPDPTIDTPFRSIQQTIYNEEHLKEVRDWMKCRYVGEQPQWKYHGNMVNNYSFCSIALRKRRQ